MNIHDHYHDLLHLLDLSGYPSSKLDGPVPEYEDPGNDDSYDAEQVADCCDYLTGILVAHMEQLNQPSPATRRPLSTDLTDQGRYHLEHGGAE